MTRTLAIVGAGRLGRTLGMLWHEAGVFEIGAVSSRAQDKAERATAVIGAGRPVTGFGDLADADVVMLSVSDDALAGVTAAIAGKNTLKNGAVVFHCSGAKSSALLAPLAERGARTASLHPVKSFADPVRDGKTFPGTWCALEGDETARDILRGAVEAIGGNIFTVSTERKLAYHAGTVIAANYLTALMDTALRCLDAAGIDRDTGIRVLDPLARHALDNILDMGPASALTGPIVRGDTEVVRDQYAALVEADPRLGEVYRLLGEITADLAAGQGNTDADALAKIRETFENPPR